MPRTIILDGAPISTQHLYGRSGRRTFMYPEAKALKEAYGWQAMTQWKGKPLKDMLALEIRLYFPDKKRRDWDNWHKLSCDALNGVVYEDDSQIVQALVHKAIDAKRPRIEIVVREYPM